MPELSNEDILQTIQFPHEKFRRTNDDGHLVGKNNVLVHIARLRKAGVTNDEIKMLVEDFYYDAMAEMQMQVKEKTGLKFKEFIAKQISNELAKEGTVVPPEVATS
jgi:hypothetical protein